jgi:hypothetical protein
MNDYRTKTDAELQYIAKDAAEAAKCMQGFDTKAEAKYLDQVNDACTEMHRRRQRQASFDRKGRPCVMSVPQE